jgi:hypothetical protein
MLSSATDYTCLDLTGVEGFIKGDIYPVRKARGDGSHRALKYEDLLYLHEAKLKRENYANSTFTKQKPYGRNLSNSAFKDVTSINIQNNRDYVLKDDWDLSGPKSMTEKGIVYRSGISFMIDNGAFTSVNVSNGTTHRFLSKSNVEEAYENIKKTVRVRLPSLFRFLDSYTYKGRPIEVNGGSFLIAYQDNYATSFHAPYVYGEYIGCKKAYLPLATSWDRDMISHHTLHIFSCKVLSSGVVLSPDMSGVRYAVLNDADSMPDGAGLYMTGDQSLILDFGDCDF